MTSWRSLAGDLVLDTPHALLLMRQKPPKSRPCSFAIFLTSCRAAGDNSGVLDKTKAPASLAHAHQRGAGAGGKV